MASLRLSLSLTVLGPVDSWIEYSMETPALFTVVEISAQLLRKPLCKNLSSSYEEVGILRGLSEKSPCYDTPQWEQKNSMGSISFR